MQVVSYEVTGWGVGELYADGATLLWHEPPRHGRAGPDGGDHVLVDRLRAHFAGEPSDFGDVELDLEWATPFQRAVALALRAVPWGEVVTYGELAALAGHPNAQRAAGTFCASNRFSVVVPCHRVVAATGIGSYGSLGVGYKRRLLALEGTEL